MEGKGLIKYTAISILLGVLPIIAIFALNYWDSNSSILADLFKIADGYNRDFSQQHLAVSTIASAYTKIAPLFAILMYAFCWNKLDVKLKEFDFKKWAKLLPGFIILMVGVYYLTYIGLENMSDSMYRTKRVIAGNEFFLLIYYIFLFLTNYVFVWMFLLYLYALKGLPYLKKRA